MGAERALRRLDGVRDFEAAPGGMTITVQPAPDRTLDLASLRRTLASEGVRLRRVSILADGAVEQTPEGTRFRIDGWPESYEIKGDALPEGKTRLRAGVRVEDGKPVLSVR